MSDDEEDFVVEFAPPAVHAAPSPVTENVAPSPVTERLTPAMHAPVVQLVQIPLVQDTQSQTIQDTVVRHVQLAETVEMVEVRSPLPADSAPPMCVMAPVVVVPPVVVEDVQPAPVVEFVAPVPGVTYAAPAPRQRWLLWSNTLLQRPPRVHAAPARVSNSVPRRLPRGLQRQMCWLLWTNTRNATNDCGTSTWRSWFRQGWETVRGHAHWLRMAPY